MLSPRDTAREVSVDPSMQKLRVTDQDFDSELDSASSDDEELDDDLMHIDIEESVYTDIIVTCARGKPFGVLNSCLILISCIFSQAFFAVIMGATLAKNDLDELTNVTVAADPVRGTSEVNVNLFQQWKQSADGGTLCKNGTTKNVWVCSSRSWSFEADAVRTMNDYKENAQIFSWTCSFLEQGLLFGYISVALWIGYQVLEIKRILGYALWLSLPLPRRPSSKQYSYNSKEKEGHISCLGVLPKIVVALVLFCRLYICWMLMCYGSQFLSHTMDLKDFILNSVALVFVYDIDELFFNVFLSKEKQRRVQTLQPPSIPDGPPKMFQRQLIGNLSEVVGLVFVLGVTTYFTQTYLVPFRNQYMDVAANTVCGNMPANTSKEEMCPFYCLSNETDDETRTDFCNPDVSMSDYDWDIYDKSGKPAFTKGPRQQPGQEPGGTPGGAKSGQQPGGSPGGKGAAAGGTPGGTGR